jgi:hypothetical protein
MLFNHHLLQTFIRVQNRNLLTKSGSLINKKYKLLDLNFNRTIHITPLRFESNFPKVSDSNFISDAISSNPEQVKYQIGFIADSPITRFFENALIDLHDLASLEWPTTIFIAALMFRLAVCFPIKIYQERIMAKLLNLQPRLAEIFQKNNTINTNSAFFSDQRRKKIISQVIKLNWPKTLY